MKKKNQIKIEIVEDSISVEIQNLNPHNTVFALVSALEIVIKDKVPKPEQAAVLIDSFAYLMASISEGGDPATECNCPSCTNHKNEQKVVLN